MEFRLIGLLLGLIHIALTDAFFVSPQHLKLTTQQQQRTPALPTLMAGFGAASSSSSSSSKGKNKKKDGSKKSTKLKPKKQWDRYMSEGLKSADAIQVAVRVVGSKKWLSVGEIKSKDNAHTDAAVIRHRALIGDHGRRMFPAEVLAIDKLEYGYATTNSSDDDHEWTVVEKGEAMPDDIDKMIGFRGFPDLTGFYSSSGKAATGDSKQDGYGKMKNKGITGITALEVHD